MSDLPTNFTAVTVFATIAVIAAIVGAVAWLLVNGLLRAGSLRPSVALVIALSLLTMVSIIGFIVTQTTGEQSTELATLAGMGLGGLAGAVTSVWGEDRALKTEQTTGYQELPPEYVPVPSPEPESWDLVEEVQAELNEPEDEVDAEEGWTPTLPDDSESAYDPIVEAEAPADDQEDSGA